MRKTVLVALLALLTAACTTQRPDKMDSERLVYFSFDHHSTMERFCGENYTVSLLDDGRVRLLIDEGFPAEKVLLLDDTSLFDDLLAIVKDCRMDSYKESYSRRSHISDGDAWSLHYRYDSGRSVSSGGYMAWPKNYAEARQALADCFRKWRE